MRQEAKRGDLTDNQREHWRRKDEEFARRHRRRLTRLTSRRLQPSAQRARHDAGKAKAVLRT